MISIENKKFEFIELLLKYGAQLDEKDDVSIALFQLKWEDINHDGRTLRREWLVC